MFVLRMFYKVRALVFKGWEPLIKPISIILNGFYIESALVCHLPSTDHPSKRCFSIDSY